jgi:uncharacterized surface protein with fasciclin (FAS1) repeats
MADPTVSNDVNTQWRYRPPGTTGSADITGSSALVRLLRVINTHVVPSVDVTSVSNPGVANTYAGEFVNFRNDSVYAAGNYDAGNAAKVLAKATTKNGTVYYIDKILNFSEKTIGKHLELLGTPVTSEYNLFWSYLKASSIYTLASGDIATIAAGTFYTVFAPNNAAIRAAVNAGLLPGTGVAPNKVPNFAPTILAEKELVNKFIYAHILNKKTVATDGVESGSFEVGDPNYVFVNNSTPNAMRLTDMNNRQANVIFSLSNFLSNRCTIHLIDNYLQYNN